MRKPKRPRDPNQLAKLVLDLATKEKQEIAEVETKNPNAVALGRLGGLIGGRARAKMLTAKERSKIAKLAARKRWNRRKKFGE